VELALADVGIKIVPGSGVGAAQSLWRREPEAGRDADEAGARPTRRVADVGVLPKLGAGAAQQAYRQTAGTVHATGS
jgi:hypothetical protein